MMILRRMIMILRRMILILRRIIMILRRMIMILRRMINDNDKCEFCVFETQDLRRFRKHQVEIHSVKGK